MHQLYAQNAVAFLPSNQHSWLMNEQASRFDADRADNTSSGKCC